MANFNFNEIILGGRLTADPELKQTPNGVPVMTVCVAVQRDVKAEGQPDTDFFTVTIWKKQAENVARYLRKGSSVFIIGNLQNRSWTEKDGAKRYKTDIVAHTVKFVDSKEKSEEKPETPNFEEIPQDDDLPF